MDLKVFHNMPSLGEEWINVTNPKVTVGEAFALAKERLNYLLSSAGQVSNTVFDSHRYDQLSIGIDSVKRFRTSIQESTETAEQCLESMSGEIASYKSQLDTLASEILTILNLEANRWSEQVNQLRQEEDEREKQAKRVQEKKEQHRQDILTLRGEIRAAEQSADNAERWGDMQTALEIRKGLQRFQNLNTSPGSFPEPMRDAKLVREMVALSLQREQERQSKEMG